MPLKIGDRVRFLNDVGGGKITRIIDKKTVSVENEDGFEIPFLISELIPVDSKGDSRLLEAVPNEEPDSKKNSNPQAGAQIESNAPSNQPITFDLRDEDDEPGNLLGLFVAFVPENSSNPTDSDLFFYLINDSPYRLLYVVSKWDGDEAISPLKIGNLLPDTKELMVKLHKSERNTDFAVNIQALFYKNGSFYPHQPEFFNLSLHPSKFYKRGSYIENDFFEQEALVISIADGKKEELLKTLTNKAIEHSIQSKDAPQIQQVKKTVSSGPLEVDLHIHELMDNYTHLSAVEILEVQMARFKVSLETAINAKNPKIVFIHGVGNGKLKHELRKELEKSYPKLRYQDASFKEYGYGATMVFIP